MSEDEKEETMKIINRIKKGSILWPPACLLCDSKDAVVKGIWIVDTEKPEEGAYIYSLCLDCYVDVQGMSQKEIQKIVEKKILDLAKSLPHIKVKADDFP